MSDELSRYVAISKVDLEQRTVEGIAGTSDLDSQGERISLGAFSDALPDYMRFGNVREMHQMSAVGKTKAAVVDDDGFHIMAKIVDDDAWKKVKEGVYTGFSVGGRVTKRDPDDKAHITGLNLVEISLVDRPANPNAVINVWKAEQAVVDAPAVVAPAAVEAPAVEKPAPSVEAPVAKADYESRKAGLRYLNDYLQRESV